jgi:hypothetical protein
MLFKKTTNPLFNQLVLDANVLDIAMRYREDILVMDHPRNNENFHHSAYRQFYGSMGDWAGETVMGMLLVASQRTVFRIFALHCGIAGGANNLEKNYKYMHISLFLKKVFKYL